VSRFLFFDASPLKNPSWCRPIGWVDSRRRCRSHNGIHNFLHEMLGRSSGLCAADRASVRRPHSLSIAETVIRLSWLLVFQFKVNVDLLDCSTERDSCDSTGLTANSLGRMIRMVTVWLAEGPATADAAAANSAMRKVVSFTATSFVIHKEDRPKTCQAEIATLSRTS
jgi:hypothetical protein